MRMPPDAELCERSAYYQRDRDSQPLLPRRVQRLFTETFQVHWRSGPVQNGLVSED